MVGRGRSDTERQILNHYKTKAMQAQGYQVDPTQPNHVKFDVAGKMGIPLKQGYNGNLTAEQAGKIGGQIGGAMVRDMIEAAKNQLEQ